MYFKLEKREKMSHIFHEDRCLHRRKQPCTNNKRRAMKNKKDKESAECLLAQIGLSLTDAVRLVMEMLEESGGEALGGREETLRHCRRVIQVGGEVVRTGTQTVTIGEAVENLLTKKKDMRYRTQKELREIFAKLIRCVPEIEEKKVRYITTEECQKMLDGAFKTVPARSKARRILTSLFNNAMRNGWCSRNPVDGVVVPAHKERTIYALTIGEVIRLLETTQKEEHRACAPAVGIMLWAGIRPNEVERLTVGNIDFEDKVITVPAAHSKTGGARQVTMHPVLTRWLRKHLPYYYKGAPITPTSWATRWADLRRTAGFEDWPPDVLRHTFASYYLKYFKSIQTLQLEMGHSRMDLLLTRYLAMEQVTKQAAAIFWNYGLKKIATKEKNQQPPAPKEQQTDDKN